MIKIYIIFRSTLNEAYQCFQNEVMICFEGDCPSIMTDLIPSEVLEVRKTVIFLNILLYSLYYDKVSNELSKCIFAS